MKHTLALFALLLATAGTAEAAPPKPPMTYRYCLDVRPAQCVTLPKALGKRVDKYIFKMPTRHGETD